MNEIEGVNLHGIGMTVNKVPGAVGYKITGSRGLPTFRDANGKPVPMTKPCPLCGQPQDSPGHFAEVIEGERCIGCAVVEPPKRQAS